MGKPEGKRPLGRLRLRGDDNIKMDFQEVGRRGGVMDWNDVTQARNRWRDQANTVLNLWFS